MNKVTKKNPTKYNQYAIDGLVLKYGLSSYYIRQSVSGSVDGITPDLIKSDYKKLEADINKVVQDTITKFLNIQNKQS
ncbi:hypothetical protein [Chryseobacterium sp. 2R14A]|uniref:hypothetical protein n=1 Tax=Chryseobacterium sp. 2R14A TaxID=3380353 RepID=UPI003CE966EE